MQARHSKDDRRETGASGGSQRNGRSRPAHAAAGHGGPAPSARHAGQHRAADEERRREKKETVAEPAKRKRSVSYSEASSDDGSSCCSCDDHSSVQSDSCSETRSYSLHSNSRTISSPAS